MLEIVLCDDNQKLLENYEAMILRIIKDNDLNAFIKYTASNVTDMEDIIKNGSANFFIIDIDLKDTRNGFELSKLIREKFKKAYIIFITAHLEFVFQSFAVRPFNFMAKPVTFERLQSTILDVYNDYVENFQGDQNDKRYIEIRSSGVLYKINIQDIINIERIEPKSVIYLTNSILYCNDSLTDLENMLKDTSLVRCHKSFICNKEYITELRLMKKQIVMKNGRICGLSRQYRKLFMDKE